MRYRGDLGDPRYLERLEDPVRAGDLKTLAQAKIS